MMTHADRTAHEVLWLAGDRLLRYRSVETLTAAAQALRAATDVDPAVRAAFLAYRLDGSPAAKTRLTEALDTLLDTLQPTAVTP